MLEEEIPYSYPPIHSNNLAAINDRRCLSGIQVEDCESRVEPKTKEGHFAKAGPLAGDRLSRITETALSLCGLSYSLICPWSCHQHHLPGPREESCLPVSRVTSLLNSVQKQILQWSWKSAQPLSAMAGSSPVNPGSGSSVLVKVNLLTSFWLQILKQPCDLSPV